MGLRVILYSKLLKAFSTHQVAIFASVIALLLLLFFALGSSCKVVSPWISTRFISPVTFDEGLIPLRQEVDVNIGTNYSPFLAQAGRFRILVDPLFDVCEKNTALGVEGQTFFCMAISDFTGFASFKEYNSGGVSSSLSEVAKGTSHELFKVISKRTVLVLEARILFKAIFDRGAIIHRLKLDLQGNELKVLRNIKSFLRTNQFHHVMAECFCPIDGRQIYEIDNDCEKVAAVLQDCGFVTKYDCANPSKEFSDVIAYKPPANDFLTTWD